MPEKAAVSKIRGAGRGCSSRCPPLQKKQRQSQLRIRKNILTGNSCNKIRCRNLCRPGSEKAGEKLGVELQHQCRWATWPCNQRRCATFASSSWCTNWATASTTAGGAGIPAIPVIDFADLVKSLCPLTRIDKITRDNMHRSSAECAACHAVGRSRCDGPGRVPGRHEKRYGEAQDKTDSAGFSAESIGQCVARTSKIQSLTAQ